MLYLMILEQGVLGLVVIRYCVECGGSLLWNSDFDFEDFGILQDGVVGIYTCGKCGYTYEFFDGENDIEFVRVYPECDCLN